MSGAKLFPSIADQITFQQQPDAVISQANPVSGTLYEVLPTTRNVGIKTITVNITWAVTQPTPLEVVITIDGQTVTHTFTNPVSAAQYLCTPASAEAANNQGMMQMSGASPEERTPKYLMYEGRSVRVQVRITWAVTQPTPLVCRVKWTRR